MSEIKIRNFTILVTGIKDNKKKSSVTSFSHFNSYYYNFNRWIKVNNTKKIKQSHHINIYMCVAARLKANSTVGLLFAFCIAVRNCDHLN